jgi:ClpP class serine protease
VFGERSSIIGSIGAVLEVVDFKKADEKGGVRTLDIVSAQSPRKRMDPFDADEARSSDARAQLQEIVDRLAQVFIEDVARNRRVAVDTVLDEFGRGGVFVGAAAQEAGLVDGITTLEDLISEMQATERSSALARIRQFERTTGPARTSPAAGGPTLAPTHPEASMAEDKHPAAGAERPVIDRAYLAANHSELLASLLAEGATAERERILAIQALHGPDALKAECAKDPKCSAGDAALKLNAAQAAADAARGQIHLQERAGAEQKLEAPAPSGDVAAQSEVQKLVARSRHLHESLAGAAAPAQA